MHSEMKLPEHWVQELVPLLENEPFCLLHRLGHDAAIGALAQGYNPIGNELVWQQRLQTGTQKPEETLDDFVGECVYWQKKPTPNGLQTNSKKWQGIDLFNPFKSPSIQDGALMLARRQLSVEVAQKNLSSTIIVTT